MDSEEIDPIAKKLRDAATQKQEAKDASAGETLLTADFAKLARGLGPVELATMATASWVIGAASAGKALQDANSCYNVSQ
jgi:hypothetical protein